MKVGAALIFVAVAAAVVALHFWPQAHDRAQPTEPARALGGAAIRVCARHVLNDWIRTDRIRGGYPRQCYESALKSINQGDTKYCERLYGAGSLCEDLKARLESPT